MADNATFLNKLFPKKQPASRREIPPMEEIVEHMQGQELSFFADTVVRVIPSKDRTKRIILLQSEHGYFKAIYEEIHVWDEDEWNYFCNDLDRYPAWWEPVASSINSNSFFGTEDDIAKAVMDSKEYKTYFV